MESSSRYCRRLLGWTAIGMAAVALFNFIIDPLDLFSIITIDGFNREKTRMLMSGARRELSVGVMRGKHEAIILGSSRVLLGMNPRYRAFGQKPAFSIGLPAANMYEIQRVFEFCRRRLDLKVLVMGLDFFSFSKNNKFSGDFSRSLFAGKNPVLMKLDYLFSQETMTDSYRTFRENRTGMKSSYAGLGSRDLNIVFKDKVYKTRRAFRNSSIYFLTTPGIYPRLVYGEDRVEIFREILHSCREDGVDLYLFISPVHARQLEVLKAIGMWPLYEEWKRDLVRVVEETNQSYPDKAPLKLWDFSGYNRVTTEDVPADDKNGGQMLYYWEASHYKQVIGDRVLDIIMETNGEEKPGPDEFGVVLTYNNIDDSLEQIRRDRIRYARTHPQEVKDVEELARATRRFNVKGKIRAESTGGQFLP